MVYILFGINDVDYVRVFMATIMMMVMMIGDGHYIIIYNEDLKRGFNSDRCDLVKSKPKSRGQAGSYTVPNINLSPYIEDNGDDKATLLLQRGTQPPPWAM